MRYGLQFLAGLALFGTAVASDSLAQTAHVNFGWIVSIDAQGHVTSIQPPPNQRLLDRLPQMRQRIEQEIRTWQFVPGTVNHVPAPTETGLRVQCTLIGQSANSIRIRIDRASVGVRGVKTVVPRYSMSAADRFASGEVVMKLDYDAGGRVVHLALVPTAPKVDSSLIAAAKRALRQWRFDPEIVGGHPLAGSSVVPVCFHLHHGEGKCDWKPVGSDHALQNGETLALNPAAKLLTDVTGRTL